MDIRKWLASDGLYLTCRIGLAALFLYAGVIKLADSRAFAQVISAYGLIPEILLPVVAVGLPAIETLAGLALFFDIRGSLEVISGLLVLFIAVLGFGIIMDLDVDTGCFGVAVPAKREGLRHAFYRDVVLIGVVVPYLHYAQRHRLQKPMNPAQSDKNA